MTFGRTGIEQSLQRCLGYAFDVNRDGLPDLTCIFRSGLTGFQAGDSEGVLIGRTVESVVFEGQDDVLVLAPLESRLFISHLTGKNEAPPVETDARGTAIFQLGRERAELSFAVIIRGIDRVTAAHIHCGPEGENGPIGVTLVDGHRIVRGVFFGSIGSPDPENGCGWDGLDAVLTAMRSGDTYVNVHTAEQAAGEIRGQIVALGR